MEILHTVLKLVQRTTHYYLINEYFTGKNSDELLKLQEKREENQMKYDLDWYESNSLHSQIEKFVNVNP